jgi:hypothetical protein
MTEPNPFAEGREAGADPPAPGGRGWPLDDEPRVRGSSRLWPSLHKVIRLVEEITDR